MDSTSQAYSGAEDNSTDPQETLTETSNLTFMDAPTFDGPAENCSLHGVTTVCLKEFVLIDDDDDGDMSLREKTVTDLSIMNGRAAELVCGRVLAFSSSSESDCGEEETVAPETPTVEDVVTPQGSGRCCSCTVS
uniref:Uncharacterized protein n=1 Tax=Cynoglossus semilaevis TaxID=244447 RepID=A0A3P8VKA0_CYNSE